MKKILILALIMSGCATSQVKRDDQFIVSGMEQPSHVFLAQSAANEQVGKTPTLRVPKGYQRLSFETPTGLKVNLLYPHRSSAIGRPNKGRLVNGRCIRHEGPGYIHFGPNSCATDQTVTLLMFALGRLRKVYPDTPPIVIGSLSAKNGGPIRPHHSHQNGRDFDVGFIPVQASGLRSFKKMAPSDIDFEKTFFFMAVLLSTGKVQYIFVDYGLQKYLYRAAMNMGYSDRQLEVIFQYPANRYRKKGIIRYSPGHRDHFHVRFTCPDGDEDCVE